MATQKNNGHELKVEIKGFVTFKPVLKANGKMALLKVGVQVQPTQARLLRRARVRAGG